MYTRLEGDDPGELQPAQRLDGHDEEGLAEGGGEEGRGLCVWGVALGVWRVVGVCVRERWVGGGSIDRASGWLIGSDHPSVTPIVGRRVVVYTIQIIKRKKQKQTHKKNTTRTLPSPLGYRQGSSSDSRAPLRVGTWYCLVMLVGDLCVFF